MRIQYEKLHVPFDQVPISHEQMEPGKKKRLGAKKEHEENAKCKDGRQEVVVVVWK